MMIGEGIIAAAFGTLKNQYTFAGYILVAVREGEQVTTTSHDTILGRDSLLFGCAERLLRSECDDRQQGQ